MSPFDPNYKPQLQRDPKPDWSRKCSERRTRELAEGKPHASGYLGPLKATTPDEHGQRQRRSKAGI